MRTIEAIRRSGVGIDAAATIHDAAKLMDRSGVGALVVRDGSSVIGIVTDRDLVRRGLARGLTLDARVDGVMSAPLKTIEADADLHDAFAIFRRAAVRRLVVLDHGEFVGTVSVDDLLVDLAADLADLVRPITAEVLFAHRDPAVPATTGSV